MRVDTSSRTQSQLAKSRDDSRKKAIVANKPFKSSDGAFAWAEPVLQERKATPILVGAKDMTEATKHPTGDHKPPAPGLGGSALDLVPNPQLLGVVQAGLTAGWRAYVTPLIKRWPRYPFHG